MKPDRAGTHWYTLLYAGLNLKIIYYYLTEREAYAYKEL